MAAAVHQHVRCLAGSRPAEDGQRPSRVLGGGPPPSTTLCGPPWAAVPGTLALEPAGPCVCCVKHVWGREPPSAPRSPSFVVDDARVKMNLTPLMCLEGKAPTEA